MVRFGLETVAESMEVGREAAEYISSHFVKPIKLEFEKVRISSLLLVFMFCRIQFNILKKSVSVKDN